MRERSRRVGSGTGTAASSARVYGVASTAVHHVGRANLHDPPEIHHGNAVGDLPHHREVVGHEELGETEIPLELSQQVHQLCLYRHIQGADRLVGDQELRTRGKRTGNADALTLTAREFMREPLQVLLPQPDAAQRLERRRTALYRWNAADSQRVAHDPRHSATRVERAQRILEHHLHLGAQRPQRALGEARDVGAVERDGPETGSSSRIAVRASVLLPHPDSPTRRGSRRVRR